MAEEIINDSEPSTSSSQITDQSDRTSNLIRLPMVVLERLDEQTLLNLQSPTPSKKANKRVRTVSDKVQKVLKSSHQESDDTNVKRSKGRPKKVANALSLFKKNNAKVGVKNKTSNKASSPMLNKKGLKSGVTNTTLTSKKTSKEDLKLPSKPGKLLKKTILQKKSKVIIPLPKKPKAITPSPKKSKVVNPTPKKAKLTPNKFKPKSFAAIKPTPPKPKLEIIQSKPGENSSDTSGDEFLYDELIEELENTANKRPINDKSVPEKTTITLKPNAGNKPPTVLKGGIIKRTDLPSDLNVFAPSNKSNSNITTNGLQKPKQTLVTPGGKRKSSDVFGPAGSVKKSSPWPISLMSSPKKSQATRLNIQKKKEITSKVAVSQLGETPTTLISPNVTNSPFALSEDLAEPIFQSKPVTIGMPKVKIGPKQTAKVVPLSKSFDTEEDLSDEYLEEETLEFELEIEQHPMKKPQIKSSPTPLVQIEDDDANLDLLKILTDDSEGPLKAKINDAKEKSAGCADVPINSREEKGTTQKLVDTRLDTTCEEAKDVGNEEVPIRTIYDLMNDVFLEYPSWNLHVIPETSAFCIAQVTKGRLGLPTLKKCIELDPVSYSAKVYIHQYHIKRFDGVYDGEESILALIGEIDSIKA